MKYKILLNNISPEILAYKDIKGNIVEQTGLSNVTHVGNRSNLKVGINVYIGHFNYIDSSLLLFVCCLVSIFVSQILKSIFFYQFVFYL